MFRRESKLKRLAWAGAAVILATVAPALLRADDGFHETFADDPIASGRWSIMPGENASRFTYSPVAGTITAAYDSGLTTARLVRPLGRTLHETDSFSCSVRFTINSAGFYADSFFDTEISFGFLNSTTTGPDRVGFSSAPKAFNLLTLDYFPNVTFFGGPSLVPTIIHKDVGQGFFAAIDFESGAETQLTDPGENDLPQDVPLVATIRYRGDTQKVTLRLSHNGQPLPINAGGGLDGDATTINTILSGPGFDVNAFGILLWKDTYTNSSIVVADLVFDEITVVAPAFGDFDYDADVDADDQAIFESCARGPAIAVDPACQICDFDNDQDVDADDFGAFQRSLTSTP